MDLAFGLFKWELAVGFCFLIGLCSSNSRDDWVDSKINELLRINLLKLANLQDSRTILSHGTRENLREPRRRP